MEMRLTLKLWVMKGRNLNWIGRRHGRLIRWLRWADPWLRRWDRRHPIRRQRACCIDCHEARPRKLAMLATKCSIGFTPHAFPTLFLSFHVNFLNLSFLFLSLAILWFPLLFFYLVPSIFGGFFLQSWEPLKCDVQIEWKCDVRMIHEELSLYVL